MKLRLIAASFLIAASAYGQGSQTPIYNGLLQSDLDAAGFKILSANMADYAGTGLTWNVATNQFDVSAVGGGSGTVTSITADFPITITPDPTTTIGSIGLDLITESNWDTAYAHRLRWDGGATGLTAATGRTSLGLVIGTNVEAWLGNPSVNGYVLSSTTGGVRSWIAPATGGGGAPTTVDYLVGTADATLSSEIVVGTTPGGELGGTWASPTIDDSISVTSWTLVTPTIAAISNLTGNGFVKTSGGIGTLSVDTSTYLTANQSITLSGDVSGGPAATSITTAIGANKVTLAMMATMATDSILGRKTASTGNVEVLTALPWADTGDVTRAADGAATVLAAGNAGNLNSGTLLAARMPALTGEVTTTVGTVATTIADSVTVTGWTLGSSSITALSNLTTNGFVKTGGGVGTLSVDTSTYLTSTSISDTAYAGTWDTVTTIAPSKNAVYDKIETLQPLDTDLTSLAGISGVRGDVIFYGASGWTRLGVGTSGNQLTTNGAGADPTWAAPGAGGGSGDVVGPASSVASEIALFDGITGKLIKSATGSGLVTATSGVYGTTTNNTANWDTAYTNNLRWDGGSTSLVAATGRTSLALNNVTNDAQTQAAIVPNTAPSTGQILVGNAGGTAYAKQTVSGSGATITMGATGVLTISAIANASLSDADLTTWAGITPSSNLQTWFSTPSSANLRTLLSDENGTGAALFSGATAPDFTTGFTIGAAAASGKILVGNGTNYVPSTPTFPATSSATSRKFIVSDGTNWVASTETQAVPGTSGNLLTSDGTNWLSSAPVVTTSNTVTFTNKRISPRVTTITSNATLSPSADNDDIYAVSALAVAITTISAPTGTPVDGQKLIIRVISDSSVRAISGWNAIYRFSSSLPAPSTTVASTTHTWGFMYNTTAAKWDCLAIAANP